MAEIVIVMQAENGRISPLDCQTHERGRMTDEVLKVHPVWIDLTEKVEENRVKTGIVIIGTEGSMRREIIDCIDDTQAMIFFLSHAAFCPREIRFSAKDGDLMSPFLQTLGQIIRDYLHTRPLLRGKPMHDLHDAHLLLFSRPHSTHPAE
jgi:hypothetical protein